MKFFILSLLFYSSLSFGRDPISGNRYQQLSGMKIQGDAKDQWDKRYSRPSFVFGKSPVRFLAENYQYIPYEGAVLDMGMGEGRNAVFLAQKGYRVTGIDISSVAVKKAYMLAEEFGVKFKGVVASLNDYKITPASFDAIICFYYVDRSLIEKMKSWLKPGGILIYEAYTVREVKSKKAPEYNPDYYLKEQELLSLFPGMRVLKYEEPLHEKEFRSSIILKKE
jgi:SAM-dependent methyltransferase